MSNINITTLFANQTVTIIKKDKTFVESIRIVSAVDMFGISFYDSMEQPKFLSYEELKEYNIIYSLTDADFINLNRKVSELAAVNEELQNVKKRYNSVESYIDRWVNKKSAQFNISFLENHENIVTVTGGECLVTIDKELRVYGKPYTINQSHPVVILNIDDESGFANIGTFVNGEWFEFTTLIHVQYFMPFTVTSETLFFKRNNCIQTKITGIVGGKNTFATRRPFDPETGYLI